MISRYVSKKIWIVLTIENSSMCCDVRKVLARAPITPICHSHQPRGGISVKDEQVKELYPGKSSCLDFLKPEYIVAFNYYRVD